ncbi:MAG: sigma-70 family RNA polymerase sigma factor [Holophagales bacterium]|nr:MAG: sigma-70 family RNA polymerase sigma factor [Holophagales bacterium]
MPELPLTELLAQASAGERAAVDRVFEIVYVELRRLARWQRGRAGSAPTLSTTMLVHETYLKLAESERLSVRDRAHFFALAARAMRQILLDAARRRMRDKRGGGEVHVPIEVLILEGREPSAPMRAAELVALDAALERLAAADERLARLVEWRFFAGRSEEEIGAFLGISERTVRRDWRKARAFLFRELAAAGYAPTP